MKEKVFIIPREKLEHVLTVKGLNDNVNINLILNISNEHGTFLDRDLVENSPTLKQLIPYVVIHDGRDFFCYKRSDDIEEERLRGLMSFGIGGHINPIDKNDRKFDVIMAGLKRELNEEVGIVGKYDLKYIGILNNDEDEIGQVHLGIIYALKIHKYTTVYNKEREKQIGKWYEVEDIKKMDKLESWSKIILDYGLDKFLLKSREKDEK